VATDNRQSPFFLLCTWYLGVLCARHPRVCSLDNHRCAAQKSSGAFALGVRLCSRPSFPFSTHAILPERLACNALLSRAMPPRRVHPHGCRGHNSPPACQARPTRDGRA
jgi:hypothetical protein